MKKLTALIAFAAASVLAQTPATPIAAIGPDSARCDDVGPNTICIQQTSGQNVTLPEEVVVAMGGQPQGPIVVSATVVSPSGRPWLRINAPAQAVSPTVTGSLPFDFRVTVDGGITQSFGAGAYFGYINIFAGNILRSRIPVVLKIVPETDILTANPQIIFDIVAPAQGAPVIRTLIVDHTNFGGPGSPSIIEATPATNDGRAWLLVNLRGSTPPASDRPCGLFPTPCGIEVIVAPPAASGDYIGAVALSDGTRSTLVPIRARITTSFGGTPVETPPGAIVLSAPIGSRERITRTVTIGALFAGTPFNTFKEAEWLSVTPSGPYLPATFTIVVDPSGLEPGTYTDTIVLTSAETGGLLALIPISLNITSPNDLPLLRQGGGWQSTLYVVNHGPEEVSARLRFWTTTSASTGMESEPWSVVVKDRGPLFGIDDERIPSGGIRAIATASGDRTMTQGWAELLASGPVASFVVLEKTAGAGGKLPASTITAPLARAFQEGVIVPFEHAEGDSTTVTLVNASADAVRLSVKLRNQDGAESGRPADISLGAYGQTVLTLGKDGAYPETANRTGSIEFAATGARLHAFAYRVRNGQAAEFPVVPKTGLSTERGFPLMRYGGGWSSTLTVFNPTTSNQTGGLRFRTGTTGAALAVPLADSETPREVISPVAPARGVLDLSMTGSDALTTGWTESVYPAVTSGFATLRFSTDGDAPLLLPYQTTVPASPYFVGNVAFPFDNGGGRGTEFVLANLDEQATEIQVVVSDRLGRFSAREIGTFRMAPRGHAAVRVEQFDESWAGRSGIVEFRSRSGNRLSGTALALNGDSMTSAPAQPAR
ncbi:MAG: hypothetical protein R2729_20080 [Bryobacteraceae bacterium]